MSEDKISEIAEQNRKNIETLADAIGARVEDSPEAEDRRKAFFTGATQEAEKSDEVKTFEQMEKNAENIVRICESLGIRSSKIFGEATKASESDAAKSLFLSDRHTEMAEKNERARKSFDSQEWD